MERGKVAYSKKKFPGCQLMLQVDMPSYEVGDVVRVIDDIAEVFRLQKGHGEWNDDMALVRVRSVTPLM